MYGTPDLIIFGIKAGMKLAQQGRQAYVEATIDRRLTLPLPDFNPDVSTGIADGFFFGEGSIFLKDNPRAKELYDISITHSRSLTEEEEKEYEELYIDFKRDLDIKSGKIRGDALSLSKEALLSLVSIRQWAGGKSPFPSAFQRTAGTLIEISIDYFSKAPGVIDESSARGRALKGFLKSIDDLNFAEERVDQIAKGMCIAVLETIGENVSLLGADDKTEKLIEVAAKGLVQDVRKRLDALGGKDLSKQEKIEQWAQVILRSLLSTAGETVFANPGLFLDIDKPAQQAMVSSVATSVLDIIIDETSVDFSKVFSREGLDKVIKASLKTLSENPDLIGIDHKGLNNILIQVARELAEAIKVIGHDIIPDIIRIILEKTAFNNDLLWPDEFRKDPAKHLLITASKELLNQLAQLPVAGEAWRPRLTKGQILELFEVISEEVIENPEWIEKVASDKGTILGETVEAAISALRKVPSHRISSETSLKILHAVIKAVALRKELLDEIPLYGEQKKAITSALETIIDAVFMDTVDPQARWTLARGEIFSLIISTVLNKLAETGISEPVLNEMRGVLDASVKDLSSGMSWEIDSLIENIKHITA